MEHSMTRKRVAPICRPVYTEMDAGYFSVSGSSSSGQSESSYGASETVSESVWSRDSLPFLQEQSIRSDAMSESGWSRDSPPNFSQQSNRVDNTSMTLSVQVAVGVIIVVAAMLYFAGNLFSRETLVNQDVKIVLMSGSGAEKNAVELAELLNQIINLQKLKEETRVQVIQTRGSKRPTKYSGLTCVIKFFCLVLTVLFIMWCFVQFRLL